MLLQIYRGPWVDNVVKNPLLRALEREERIVDPSQDAQEGADVAKVDLIREARLGRTQGVDTDAFRESLEKGKVPNSDLLKVDFAWQPMLTPMTPILHPFLARPAHSLAAKQALGTRIVASELAAISRMLNNNMPLGSMSSDSYCIGD